MPSTDPEQTVEKEVACEKPDRPHTVWWMVEDGDPIPVPREARFDNRADAMEAAGKLPSNPQMIWVKVFRSDNESYTCWRWENPDPPRPPWADMQRTIPVAPDPVGFPVGAFLAVVVGLVAVVVLLVVTHV